ncbi:hypothetical protein ACFX1W_009244 [Malus domestica]
MVMHLELSFEDLESLRAILVLIGVRASFGGRESTEAFKKGRGLVAAEDAMATIIVNLRWLPERLELTFPNFWVFGSTKF